MTNRKKIMGTIALFLVAIMSLSVVTYAWFTTTRLVDLQGLNLVANAETDLLVKRTDAGAKVSEGTATKSLTMTRTVKFAPSTGNYKDSWTFADGKAWFAQIRDNKATADREIQTEATDNYFQYSKVSKSVNEGAQTYFDLGTGDAEPYLYYYDFTLEFSVDMTKNGGVLPSDLEIEVYLSELSFGDSSLANAYRLAAYDDDGTYIATYSKATLTESDGTTLDVTSGARTWEPIASVENGTGLGTLGSEQTADLQGRDGSSEYKKLGTIDDENETLTINFRIWLEGQDAACVQANSTNSCDVEMKFEGAEGEAINPRS